MIGVPPRSPSPLWVFLWEIQGPPAFQLGTNSRFTCERRGQSLLHLLPPSPSLPWVLLPTPVGAGETGGGCHTEQRDGRGIRAASPRVYLHQGLRGRRQDQKKDKVSKPGRNPGLRNWEPGELPPPPPPHPSVLGESETGKISPGTFRSTAHREREGFQSAILGLPFYLGRSQPSLQLPDCLQPSTASRNPETESLAHIFIWVSEDISGPTIKSEADQIGSLASHSPTPANSTWDPGHRAPTHNLEPPSLSFSYPQFY